MYIHLYSNTVEGRKEVEKVSVAGANNVFQFILARDCLAFATEPIFASLANLLGKHDNMPSPPPHDFKVELSALFMISFVTLSFLSLRHNLWFSLHYMVMHLQCTCCGSNYFLVLDFSNPFDFYFLCLVFIIII